MSTHHPVVTPVEDGLTRGRRAAYLVLPKPFRIYLDRVEFTFVSLLWILWTCKPPKPAFPDTSARNWLELIIQPQRWPSRDLQSSHLSALWRLSKYTSPHALSSHSTSPFCTSFPQPPLPSYSSSSPLLCHHPTSSPYPLRSRGPPK